MKIGDQVRFLSEAGGGRVSGFQGKNIVLVEDEDGFEIPMQMQEVVVVGNDWTVFKTDVIMEQEMTIRDVANYLDNVGIQFLATIGLDGKPKVRPMQYNPRSCKRAGE